MMDWFKNRKESQSEINSNAHLIESLTNSLIRISSVPHISDEHTNEVTALVGLLSDKAYQDLKDKAELVDISLKVMCLVHKMGLVGVNDGIYQERIKGTTELRDKMYKNLRTFQEESKKLKESR